MSKKEVRQAAAELTERLCEKDFLDRSGLSRKNVMMLMNKDHWEEQFAHIFPIKKRISCRAVYEILYEGRDAATSLDALFHRSIKNEF